MYESTADTNVCLFFELFQIGVVVVVDYVEESHPTVPAVIYLFMSRFGNPFLPGHFCASCAIQEIRFCGSLIILDFGVERDGCIEVSIEVIWSFYMLKYREKLSVIKFNFPINCWE